MPHCGYPARAASIKKRMSSGISVVPSRFGDGSNLARGKCQERPSGTEAESAEFSRGKREALGLS